jgi:RHS repeat-associated protein
MVTSELWGAYDPLGRIATMKADDGRVVSARAYGDKNGALLMECKRFQATTTCAGSALDTTKDIYRTDRTPATFQGSKLSTWEDYGTNTSYSYTYSTGGRLKSATARPNYATNSTVVAPLAQDWYETYSYNGIGNLRGTGIYLNLNNTRPDYMASEDYRPVGTGTNTLDRLDSVRTAVSAGTPAVTAGTTSYAYDLLGHLTKVTRTAGESESLYYAPGGELAWRQVGEKFVFYVGEYATVTARGAAGCGASCMPVSTSVELDAHVVFAGTRIASVKPSRTLYYYRTRLGSVIATSLGGGLPGAAYRYDAHGEVELVQNETDTTRSELGYTNALRLTGSLLHLKNRVYDTDARVFIQPDVVDRLRYAYVVGDPVNSSDPTGLKADQESPVVDARYSYDGAWVYVREERADGSTTYNAYDLSIPTDFEAFSRFQDQVALQKEQGGGGGGQGLAEWAGGKWRALKAWVSGVDDKARDSAKETGAATVQKYTSFMTRAGSDETTIELNSGTKTQAGAVGAQGGEAVYEGVKDGAASYAGANSRGR